MSSSAPTTHPITAPTAASARTSRQSGIREPRLQCPASPAATPTQPTAKTWYGTQGPIPPPTTAETRIDSAPARNPNEVPKTYPAHRTRKKIGLKPPMPSITARRRAVSMAAIAASNATARESSWRIPVSTRKSPTTEAIVRVHAGVLAGRPLPKNGHEKRATPANETTPTGSARLTWAPRRPSRRPCHSPRGSPDRRGRCADLRHVWPERPTPPDREVVRRAQRGRRGRSSRYREWARPAGQAQACRAAPPPGPPAAARHSRGLEGIYPPSTAGPAPSGSSPGAPALRTDRV